MLAFEPTAYSFTISAVPTLVTMVAILLLGVFALLRDRVTPTSVTFFTLTLAISIWLVCVSFMYMAETPEAALWWGRVTYLGVPFIAPAAYSFTITVLHIYRRWRLVALCGWLLAALFAALALWTNELIDGVRRFDWGDYVAYNWLGLPFIASFVLLLLACLWHYWQEYRAAAAGKRKERIGALLRAFAVGCLGAVDFVPVYGVPLYPFGYLAILGFVILIARAIWTYRLDDITPALAAHQIIETMSNALLVLDTDGVVRVANGAASELFNIPHADLIDQPATATIGAELFAGDFQALLSDDGAPQRYEIEYPDAAGHPRNVGLTASVKRDQRGRPQAVVYIAADISVRKRAETEIRALNESLEQRVAERTAQLETANAGLEKQIARSTRLAEALDRALAESRLLNVVLTTAAGQEDVSRILAAALDNLSRVIPFSGGSIALVEGDDLVVRAAIGPFADQALGTSLPRGRGKAWAIVSGAAPFMSGDLASAGVRALSPVRSFLGVPIIWNGLSFGLLEVDSTAPDAFDDSDLTLMKKVADALSGSIQLATLYGQIQSAMRGEQMRSVQLRRLSDASISVNSLLALDDVLQVITDQARETVGAHQAVTNIVAGDSSATARTSISLSEKYAAWREREEPPRDPAIYALFDGANRSLRLSAAQLAEHPQQTTVAGVGAAARPLIGWLAVPLFDRNGERLGLIELSDKDEGEFSGQDEDILVQFAQMAAVAVENARLYREAADAVRAREVLLSVVSHDLRNLLTAVGGSAKLLKRLVGPPHDSDERVDAGLRRIDEAVVRMNALIGELLDFARLQAGQPLELYYRRTDLVALVNRLAQEQQLNTERHRIIVQAVTPELQGLWDSARIERTLLNLLSNAVKYSPRGGDIIVSVGSDNGCAVLTVRDQGIGIPEADLPHVFEWFRRAGNVSSRISGTGVGLASVAQVVQEHGGTITVESKEGGGSAFILRLPLQPGHNHGNGAHEK